MTNEMQIKPGFEPIYWLREVNYDQWGVHKRFGKIVKIVSGTVLYGWPLFDDVAIIPKTEVRTPTLRTTIKSESGTSVKMDWEFSFRVTNARKFMEEAPVLYQSYTVTDAVRIIKEVIRDYEEDNLLQKLYRQLEDEVTLKISPQSRAMGLETKLWLMDVEILPNSK